MGTWKALKMGRLMKILCRGRTPQARKKRIVTPSPTPAARTAAPASPSRRAGEFSLAGFFAGLNIKRRIGRDILFVVFMALIAAVSFALTGELWMHRDGTLTKNYSDDAFARRDTTRLVAVKADGSAFSESDAEKIRRLSSVTEVDTCDYCNDINFYMTEGVDYEITYSRRGWFGGRVATLNFLNNTRFMKSAACLTESDLACGRLPNARGEMVLYGEESLMGKKFTVYFAAKNLWGSGEYCSTELEIVGILKTATDSVYFSTALATELGMNMDSALFRLYYAYNTKSRDYSMKPKVTLIVNESLTGNDVIVSEKLSTLPGYGNVIFKSFERDDDGNVTGTATEDEVNVTGYTSRDTSLFMEVSPEFFSKYYSGQTRQLSVYLTSYAKTDPVIKQLTALGCHAVSTYRVGASEYIVAKVNERVTIVGICSAGLLVILVVAVLILRALMRLNLSNFRLLDFIGAKLSVLKLISVIEMAFFCCVGVIIATAVAFIARAAGVTAAGDIIEYMTPLSYMLFVLYNYAITGLAVFGFNRLLKRRLA